MYSDQKKDAIISYLRSKSVVKQQVFEQTKMVFKDLKLILEDLQKEFNNDLLSDLPDSIKLKYRERGPFEVELKVAGDLLIFSMHSNIFQFDRNHPIWTTDEVKQNSGNSFSGVIRTYNFLSDSFKYNRTQDLGYLVSRLFINQKGCFMIEGKRQNDNDKSNGFSANPIGYSDLRAIVLNSIFYTLQFELLVPPYDQVKIASVEQMHDKITHSKMKTGKRVGFKFNSDDV